MRHRRPGRAGVFLPQRHVQQRNHVPLQKPKRTLQLHIQYKRRHRPRHADTYSIRQSYDDANTQSKRNTIGHAQRIPHRFRLTISKPVS